MIEALGGRGGKIGVLDLKQVESCILRVKGFKEVLDAHNASAAQKIEIVSELDGGGAKDKGYKAAEDMLQAHPDLVGIFAINDPSALGRAWRAGEGGQGRQGRDHRLRRSAGGQAGDQGRQDLRRSDPVPRQDGRGSRARFLRYSKGEELPPQMLIPTSCIAKVTVMADKDLK
jgi:ribose transport system substrate-binding protein